ncbi:MAG: hypothetical protein PVG41_07600 [Desulfobacteraceae bacterium]|jgi:hypothetical protein
MTVKLNHYWGIIPTLSEEYNKFIVRKFIPGVNQLGMHTVAVWSVLAGVCSEIIFETACSDLEHLEKALHTKKYKELKTDLFNYIKNYNTKILVKSDKKDHYTIDVEENTVKFNQTWDLISNKRDEYKRFTDQEYYPLLHELGIEVAREWEVFIGSGPNIICEGRATDVTKLITNLQSETFHKAERKLKEYVERYESRILTFHIQKIKGYKSASYRLVSS